MLPLYPRAHGVLLLILLLSHEAHQQPKPAAGEEKVLKIEDVKVKPGIYYKYLSFGSNVTESVCTED